MKNIKSITLLISLLIMFNTSKAQGLAFESDKVYVSLGYGAPNISELFFKSFNNEIGYNVNGLGPLHGKFEYGLSDNIGLGISFNYVSTEVRWQNGTFERGYDYFSIASNVRLNFHFLDEENFDLYYGFGFGYNYFSLDYVDTDPTSQDRPDVDVNPLPLGFETTIGVRYLFSPNVGIYAEFGWAKSIVQGGLIFKI